MRASARRFTAMAMLRAATMQIRMPARSVQRNGIGGVLRAFSLHAIAAANSANGNAKSVWLKRIISRMWRSTGLSVVSCQWTVDSCRLVTGRVASADSSRAFLTPGSRPHQPPRRGATTDSLIQASLRYAVSFAIPIPAVNCRATLSCRYATFNTCCYCSLLPHGFINECSTFS